MATGDEASVLTSSVNPHLTDVLRGGVWEHVVTDTRDEDDTGDTTQTINLNGILKKVILKVPDTTNAITSQVVIKDNGDNTIFDSGEQAENATYAFNVDEPLSGAIDVVIGVSGAIGGSGVSSDIVVTLRGV